MPASKALGVQAGPEPLESFFPQGCNAPSGPLTCLAQVPEPVWTCEGTGDGRVFRTVSLGRAIRLARGVHYSCEMWLLSVEDEQTCYWDDRLSLAKSRGHIALALDEHDRRQEGRGRLSMGTDRAKLVKKLPRLPRAKTSDEAAARRR